MKGFYDLPNTVREKIYRMHLVQDNHVKFSEFKAICNCSDDDEKSNKKPPRIMPSLLRLSRKIELEGKSGDFPSKFARSDKLTFSPASPIYFGENVFEMEGWKGIQHWLRRLWPRHAQQIRKVILAEWGACRPQFGYLYFYDFKRLKLLRMLQSLVMVVDENKLLRLQLDKLRRTNKWHDGLELGPRVYLQMMHIEGMASLRALRGLQNVEFRHPDPTEQQGSISGGFLETVVKREIMQSADVQV